jgi:hypothetical protein
VGTSAGRVGIAVTEECVAGVEGDAEVEVGVVATGGIEE